MPLFTLNKVVTCPCLINSINNVLIDEDFSYITLYEGIRVQGKIYIKGDYIGEENSSSFNDEVDVDIMCPNEQISDIRGILLKINDYSYQINENEIKFTFKCILEGKEPVKEVFEYNDNNSFLEIEVPPTELIISKSRSYLTKEEANELEAMLEKEDVSVITTFNEEIVDDNLIEKDEEKEDEIKEETSLKEDEVTSFYKVEESRNELINDESVVIISSYYRISKNDTEESIMKKCNISLEEVRSIELKEGQLIKIRK